MTRTKVTNLAHRRKRPPAGSPPAFCHGRCVGVTEYAGICKCPCRGLNHGTNHAHRREPGESYVQAWARGFEKRARRLVSREVRALAADHRKNRLADPVELERRHAELRAAMTYVNAMLALAYPERKRAVG